MDLEPICRHYHENFKVNISSSFGFKYKAKSFRKKVFLEFKKNLYRFKRYWHLNSAHCVIFCNNIYIVKHSKKL